MVNLVKRLLSNFIFIIRMKFYFLFFIDVKTPANHSQIE